MEEDSYLKENIVGYVINVNFQVGGIMKNHNHRMVIGNGNIP